MANNRKRIQTKKLLDFVEAHAIDLKEMARRAGIGYATIRRARDGAFVNPSVLRDLAKFMKIKPEDLIDDSDNPEAEKLEWRVPFAAYLKECKRIFGAVDFLGMDFFQDDKALDLTMLYVQPQLANMETRSDFFEMNDEQKAKTGRKLYDLSPQFFLDHGPRTVLLAGAGYGKTLLVRWLAVMLSSPRRNEWRDTFNDCIPLPMILREMRLTREVNTWEKLLYQLNFAKFDVHSFIHPDALKTALQEGRVWIMLDGLDEISPDVRIALHTAIWDGFEGKDEQGNRKTHPDCRWLATSRIQGYEAAPLEIRPSVGFPRRHELNDSPEPEKSSVIAYPANQPFIGRQAMVRELLSNFARLPRIGFFAPFDDDRIQRFSGNWYLQRETTAKLAQDRADDFWGAIRQAPDTLRLGRIPSLLALMALIHRNLAILPKGRVELYEKIARSYLETIDKNRGMGARYTYNQAKRWLGHLAYTLQCRRDAKSGRGDVVFTGSDFLQALEEVMATGDIADVKQEALLFRRHIVERSGLIAETSPDNYAFLHLTFLEFFAAHETIRLLKTAIRRQHEGTEEERQKHKGILVNLWSRTNERLWADLFLFVFQILHQEVDDDGHQDIRQALFGKDWEDERGTERLKKYQLWLLLEIVADDYSGFERLNRFGQISCRTLREILWQQVTELNLSYTAISDLAFLQSLTKLQSLTLSHTPVTDMGLAHLRGLLLKSLYLSDTPVTDAGLVHLHCLPLHSLYLQSTKVTDAGLVHLRGLPLQTLSLSDTLVTDAGMAYLHGLPLQMLFLNDTLVTDAGTAHLHDMPLRSLFLTHTKVTNAGVQKLQTAIPNLTIDH